VLPEDIITFLARLPVNGATALVGVVVLIGLAAYIQDGGGWFRRG
jgi:hypothetical protein